MKTMTHLPVFMNKNPKNNTKIRHRAPIISKSCKNKLKI